MCVNSGFDKGVVNMNIDQALYELGVRDDTLSDDDIESLDRNGFLRVENALTPEQVEVQRRRVYELIEMEGEDAGLEVHKEEGADRLGDLVNKDDIFDICFTHPKLLASIRHIVGGDFRMGALNARNVHPGYGHQAFHQDSGKPGSPGNYEYVNSIYFLVDFTEENGPTRVVPGSHSRGELASEAMDDPTDEHPDEVHLTGKAGTAYIFNAHLWHGGTINRSDGNRPAVFAYFGRRDVPPYIDQRKYIRPETYDRLGAAAKYVLDVQGVEDFTPEGFERSRVVQATGHR